MPASVFIHRRRIEPGGRFTSEARDIAKRSDAAVPKEA
jgi:hypothetical protein